MPVFKPKTQKSQIDLQTNPSGRGIGVPAGGANTPRTKIGALPRAPFHQGDMGSPSASSDVMASKLMQNVMGPDDIEYWKDIENDPPYDVQQDYLQDSMNLKGKELLKAYISECVKRAVMSAFEYELVKEDEDLLNKDDDEDADTAEASVVANVAGYTLPLGMKPTGAPGAKKKKKSPAQAYADSFARAKKV